MKNVEYCFPKFYPGNWFLDVLMGLCLLPGAQGTSASPDPSRGSQGRDVTSGKPKPHHTGNGFIPPVLHQYGGSSAASPGSAPWDSHPAPHAWVAF